MTPAVRDLSRFLLAAGLLSTAIAGCQSGPLPADGVGGAPSSRVWTPARPDTLGPILAVVGSRRITKHEIDSIIAGAPQNIQPQLRERDGYLRVVDRTVTEEVVFQAARAARADQDPAYKAEVARSARDILLRRFYQSRVDALPAPPDSAIQAYYDEHREEYAISARARVRHIQLATRAKAQSVRRMLVKGGLWDALCRAHSTDAQTKGDGGVLGFVTPDNEFVPGVGKSQAIVAAAFALKEGEISQALKSEKAWHLIRVENAEPRRYQTIAELKDRIRALVATQREEAFSRAFIDSLKETANATIFEDSIDVAIRPARTPQDIFKEAQAAATPQQRIELYRDLVKRFPDDPVSAQARFMIGFTYAEDLGDTEQATEELQKFIEKYPNHELATSAKWMMENMDKPAPDLRDDLLEGAGGNGAAPDTTRSGSPQGSDASP
jgi:tetratricopeptide (TPR) repeat protein